MGQDRDVGQPSPTHTGHLWDVLQLRASTLTQVLGMQQLAQLGHALGQEPSPATPGRAAHCRLIYYITVITLISLPAVGH